MNLINLLIQINATSEQAGQGSPQEYEKKYSSDISHSVN